nr:ubiquinol-cytochrome c reductase iron-sulfur subunit N-terminal domain-containing protein [uncultured Ralstonia sp.]
MPGPNTVPHARPQADSGESAPTRRRFLMGAAVAAAAAGTAATASHLVQAPAASAAPQVDPADSTDGGATGYRLSEHIRKYYKTTWI